MKNEYESKEKFVSTVGDGNGWEWMGMDGVKIMCIYIISYLYLVFLSPISYSNVTVSRRTFLSLYAFLTNNNVEYTCIYAITID